MPKNTDPNPLTEKSSPPATIRNVYKLKLTCEKGVISFLETTAN